METPCINICLLDSETGLCLGCGHNIDEIANWGSMSDAERRAVMARLPARLKSFAKPVSETSVTTWLALFILAFGSMLLVSNESGMIAELDETTFGYLVLWLALLVYLLGGLMLRYRRTRELAGPRRRDLARSRPRPRHRLLL